MFISHWFERSGLDQVMAPIDPDDENAHGNGEGEGGRGAPSPRDGMEASPFWDIVAPRPPAASARLEASPASAPAGLDRRGGFAANDESPGQFVRCQHCRKMTPVNAPVNNGPTTTTHLATPATDVSHPKTPHNTPAFDTPPSSTATPAGLNGINRSQPRDPMEDEQADLQLAVLRAARETALTTSGPTFVWENKHALFALCSSQPKPPKKGKDGKPVPPKLDANGKPVPSKNVKKLAKMLGSKPHLVAARSANMSSLGLPDGFTVLHAACHAGNGEVVKYLLSTHILPGEESAQGDENDDRPVLLDLSERDLQGRTALHIAADRGHIEVIQLLRGAYDTLVERATRKMLEEESDSDEDDSDDDSDDEEELAAEMAKLSTSDAQNVQSKATATPKTPKSRSPMRRKQPRPSRSPKPPSQKSPMRSPYRSPKRSPLRSPTFSGSGAPVDLSGRTPLGYAATSPAPNARKNRDELERMLYSPGDRSVVGVGGGGRTPPRDRCGPRGRPTSPIEPSGRKVAFDGANHVGANSYLSPTPQKHQSGYPTPGSAASTNYATPFQSPEMTIPEEEASADGVCGGGDGGKENALGLLWGASEMNGFRIEMEDKILVKCELYGGVEAAPPRPTYRRKGPLGKGTGPVESFVADPAAQAALVGGLNVQLFDDSSTLEFAPDVERCKSGKSFVGHTADGKWHLNLVPGRGREGTFNASVTCDKTGDVYSIAPDADGDMTVTMRAQEDYPDCSTCAGGDPSPITIPTMGIFGVFDGHGDGGFASDFVATHLERRLKSHPDWPRAYHGCNDTRHHDLLTNVITQTWKYLDEDLRRDATKPRDGGTTAIVALVSDQFLFLANVGDSRCILVRRKGDDASDKGDIEVVPMSEDHKPDLPAELARIEAAGLSVWTDHVPADANDPDGEVTLVHRLRKSDRELLGVARAFGDFDYKSNAELPAARQAVTCAPDVVVRAREDQEDAYLVLACDGVWDVMGNEEAGAFVVGRVAELLGGDGGAASEGDGGAKGSSANTNDLDGDGGDTAQGEILARVGDDLLAECLRRGSRDNMSALIVALPASGLVASRGGGIASSSRSAEAAAPGPAVAVDGTVRALAYE